jgi:diaminopimelate epimerase
VIPGVRTIPFVKASACGNDFLLIDADLAPPDIAGFTRRICDRHQGVGADGVEWMSPHSTANVQIRLINADGSEAEISGNGTRCVAAYICATQSKEKISILTGAGAKNCSLTSRQDAEYEFEMEMGKPAVETELALKLDHGGVRGIPVSMGNPHYVVFVEQFAEDWQSQAAKIQKLPHFTEGVNVEFVTVKSRHDVNVRFFERGVGETQSSGTGSCASAVAAMTTGLCDSPVKVHAEGGTQTVRSEGGSIFLRGPARLICRGDYLLT